jgi:hypothetical protein
VDFRNIDDMMLAVHVCVEDMVLLLLLLIVVGAVILLLTLLSGALI